jgi:hypothetical protein
MPGQRREEQSMKKGNVAMGFVLLSLFLAATKGSITGMSGKIPKPINLPRQERKSPDF